MEESQKSKIKVAFFGEDFSRKGMGTALVIQKLAEQFTENYQEKIEISIIRKEGTCKHPLAQKLRNIEIRMYSLPIFSTLVSYLIFFLTNKDNFDIVMFNRNVYPGFWMLRAKKFILFLYDAPVSGGYKVDLGWENWFIYSFLKYAGKYFLDAVIAVSDTSRKEIISYYNMKPEQVFTVYCGKGEEFRVISPMEISAWENTVKDKYGISPPYILDVSRLDPHKNILNLIDAFLILKKKYRVSHRLVIVGGRHLQDYTRRVEEKIKGSDYAKDIIIAPYIEDADLPAIYNLADILVYPSLLEGFGLPIIEAMSCGIPVVTSDISSMPEVSGGAALLANPYVAGQLAEKIWDILDKPGLRKELVRRGLEWSNNFSWKKTAQVMLNIYEDCLYR